MENTKEKYEFSLKSTYISNLTNCTFIGFNTGVEIEEGDGIVIIGDNIKNLNPEDNEGVLFLGSKVAIGKTIFGVPINMIDVFENYLNKRIV